MLLDNENLFSDDQAVTVTAVSEDIIDLGATGTVVGASGALKRDIGPGEPINVLVQVTEDFVGLTNMQVELQKSTDEAFTSPVVVQSSQVIVLADLLAGKRFNIYWIPHDTDERYIRLRYVVTGTATAGKVTAGVVLGHDTNIPFPK